MKNNIFKTSKKGFVLSIWWFIMAMLLSVVIYILTNMFFNSPLDVRDIEVNSLINHVSDCIYYAGKFNENIIFPLNEDENPKEIIFKDTQLANFIDKDFLIKNCHLILYDEDNSEELQYFIKVNIYELKPSQDIFNYKDNLLVTYTTGNENIEDICNLEIEKVITPSIGIFGKLGNKDNEYKTFPLCKNKKFYAFSREIREDGSRNEYIIEIIGGIKKINENVKL